MKRIITSILMLSIVLTGFSQGLFILDMNNDSIKETVVHLQILPNTSVSYEVKVANRATVVNSYKVRDWVLVDDAADQTQFCWGGTCYNFGVTNSNNSDTISRGNIVTFSTNGFHSNFQAGPASIIRKVHYMVYNVNTTSYPADTAGFTIQYDITAAGIEEQKMPGTISNVFPNPATSVVSIDYNLNSSFQKSKIIFYDVLGKEVKEVKLNDNQGTAKISTDDMFAGIYFYSLTMDSKIVATKKLVVYH